MNKHKLDYIWDFLSEAENDELLREDILSNGHLCTNAISETFENPNYFPCVSLTEFKKFIVSGQGDVLISPNDGHPLFEVIDSSLGVWPRCLIGYFDLYDTYDDGFCEGTAHIRTDYLSSSSSIQVNPFYDDIDANGDITCFE